MTERPILMSGAMVRAILAGQKTQTRRVLRGQEPIDLGASMHGGHLSRRPVHDHGKLVGHRMAPVHCPYGEPGDRLWVRETYAIVGVSSYKVSVARAERMPPGKTLADTDGGLELIEVDQPTAAWAYQRVDQERWKPAIFMPRWACRLELDVTGVRVERLQDITWQDTFAEGFEPRPVSVDPHVHRDAARDWYMDLWDSLNAKRGYGWAVNPWVWVVSFRRAAALKAAA